MVLIVPVIRKMLESWVIETWHDIFRPYLTCRWRRGSVVDRPVGPGSLASTECRRRRTVRGENWGPRHAIGCRCHSGTGSETRCHAPSPVTHVVLQQDARFLTWLKDIWYFGIMWTQLSKDMSLLSLQSQFLWLKYLDSISNLDLLINIIIHYWIQCRYIDVYYLKKKYLSCIKGNEIQYDQWLVFIFRHILVAFLFFLCIRSL